MDVEWRPAMKKVKKVKKLLTELKQFQNGNAVFEPPTSLTECAVRTLTRYLCIFSTLIYVCVNTS